MSTGNTLPDRAGTVVIGAGCVGCSAAYHLTQLGREDVMVVDRGPLYETGGSTSHAPGLVYQTAGGKLMTDGARRTAVRSRQREDDPMTTTSHHTDR